MRILLLLIFVIFATVKCDPGPQLDCQQAGDGHFVLGCSSEFVRCINSEKHNYTCPENLYFDPMESKCTFKSNVSVCNPGVLVDTFVKGSSTFNCSNQADGNYLPKGCTCSSTFVSCMSGKSEENSCHRGQFFDEKSKVCDYKENVPGCVQPTKIRGQELFDGSASAQRSIIHSCPEMITGSQNEGIPCPDSRICQGIREPLNGSYSCEAPFAVWYGPVRGSNDQWKQATQELVYCGADGYWYDSEVKINDSGIHCTAEKSSIEKDIETNSLSPPTSTDLFCEGRGDDYYGSGCQSFFYSCQGGITTKMICPMGLHYEVESHRCDQKEIIVACGGTKELSVDADLPALNRPAIAANSFCLTKENGFYGLGCETFFYSCHEGVSFMMNCPVGLYYEEKSKHCNLKENIALCDAATTTPRLPAPTTAPMIDDFAPVSNFCSDKIDGYYAEGCSDYFYNCKNGYTYKMACLEGLFYSAPTRKCLVKEAVITCGAQPQSVPQQQLLTQYPAHVAPVRDFSAVVVHNFCKGEADGRYADGCKNFFYYCSNGATLKMNCSAGLFYDNSTKQCDHIEKVVACGGTAAAAAPAVPAPPGSEVVAAPATSHSRPAAPVMDTGVMDNTCSGKQNAFFGEGCNSFYHACISGATYKMACPTGLFFDTELQSCDYRVRIPSCGGKRVEIAPTLSPALDNLLPAPFNNAQCNGKADGIYAATDCAEDYYFCQAGLLRKEACHTGLFFNEANEMCDWSTNIAKCRARDTLSTRVPETSEYGKTTSRPITYDSHKEEQQKSRKPAFSSSGASCTGHPDGYYASGCSADYTACVNGLSMAMHCPSDLRYSGSTLMCDYSDNVPECGGSTPSESKDVVPRPMLAPVVLIVPKLSTQPPVKEVHPRCANYVDGIYALAPCSQNYLACQDEKAHIGTCREDLFYSTSSGLCERKDKITACTRLVRPTPLATRSVPSTTPPVAPVPDVVRPTGDRLIRPTVPLGYLPLCSKIADGVYAINACSPYYSRCAGGRLTAYGTCPVGTFFSSTSGGCFDRSNIQSCASAVAISPPTQAPALAPATQPNYGVHQTSNQHQQQYAPSYSATYGSRDIYADPSTFCYGRVDAIYGNTCKKNYVICTQGATFAYACPRDFVFDRDRAVCDHPSRIAQCGAVPSYGDTAQTALAYQQQ